LSTLMNGRAALTPEMALRMEMAFGLSMETLMRMQQNYDIAQARARAGDLKVAPHVPRAKAAPQPSLI
jgi:plasmid maintenance system antidote protein VapI